MLAISRTSVFHRITQGRISLQNLMGKQTQAGSTTVPGQQGVVHILPVACASLPIPQCGALIHQSHTCHRCRKSDWAPWVAEELDFKPYCRSYFTEPCGWALLIRKSFVIFSTHSYPLLEKLFLVDCCPGCLELSFLSMFSFMLEPRLWGRSLQLDA